MAHVIISEELNRTRPRKQGNRD